VSRKSSSPEAIEARKSSILQAMRRSLAKEDFHTITMDDIAARARIAKGTLYLYFKDKDSLYQGLVQSLFDKLFPRLSKILETKAEPRELLRQVMVNHISFFQDHMDVFVHFFREGPGKRNDRLKDRFREYITRLAAIIQRGITKGQFRRVNPVKAAIIMLGLVRSAIVERIHGFSKEPMNADLQEIWDIYMKGIGK